MIERIRKNLSASIAAKQQLLSDAAQLSMFDSAVQRVIERYQDGGRLHIAGKATATDVFLGITTSGRCPNILSALQQCRTMGIPSVVFSGKDGGAARSLADYCIIAPGSTTSAIQEVHLVMAHTLCECVEAAICGT